MRMFKALRGVAVAACLAVGLMGVMASAAMAEAATHCVKATKTATKPRHYTGEYTNKTCTVLSATHEGEYEEITPSLLSTAEQEELKAILKYAKVVPSGVDSKPTIQVSGANVQIESGAGSEEAPVNGEGNLFIGYDYPYPGEQTGSNNLAVGSELRYTSYGSIVGGSHNGVTGAYSSVVGGAANLASGNYASVSGGFFSVARGILASVSGGSETTPKASIRRF
jgi:hypothetical protein